MVGESEGKWQFWSSVAEKWFPHCHRTQQDMVSKDCMEIFLIFLEMEIKEKQYNYI